MNVTLAMNLLRSGLMIVGAVIVDRYGGTTAEMTTAVDNIVAIVGVLMASGGAVWSFLRSLSRVKAAKQVEPNAG